MHVRKLVIRNIRSITELEIDIPEPQAGWHVILGDNGSGKSGVIRALALALIGPADAAATRQNWLDWIRVDADSGHIEVEVTHDAKLDRWVGSGRRSGDPIQITVEFRRRSDTDKGRALPPKMEGNYARRTVWAGGLGWFSASFGPFRRFSGGDNSYDRLFYSHPILAPHLSVFGEDVALGEALRWLQDLQFRAYENDEAARYLLGGLIDFLKHSPLLPHGAHIEQVTSEAVNFRDGAGARIPVEQLSDGFRSVLSMTFELLRGMTVAYGDDAFLNALDVQTGAVRLPGVVAIDEIDAHLHPAWQMRIGDWFVERFPNVQFFVTTHSPIICRAAEKGSIWRLATPGRSEEEARRIQGYDLNRLVYGSVLDAMDTEYFGASVTRSTASQEMITELAKLNRKRSRGSLSKSEERRRLKLQGTLPSLSAISE